MYFLGVRTVLLRWDFNTIKTYLGTSLSADLKGVVGNPEVIRPPDPECSSNVVDMLIPIAYRIC